jgi:hypothetical protein
MNSERIGDESWAEFGKIDQGEDIEKELEVVREN